MKDLPPKINNNNEEDKISSGINYHNEIASSGKVPVKESSFPGIFVDEIKKSKIEDDPTPGILFEKISRLTPDGKEEMFFRSDDESDDNGTNYDNRNGK